jgi:hypothetical protein
MSVRPSLATRTLLPGTGEAMAVDRRSWWRNLARRFMKVSGAAAATAVGAWVKEG